MLSVSKGLTGWDEGQPSEGDDATRVPSRPRTLPFITPLVHSVEGACQVQVV